MDKSDHKKNIRSKLISSAVSVLLVLAIFLCLYVVVQILSVGHVSIGGYSSFRVITGSMEPTIGVGELILTERVDIDEIQVDDIVCFKSQDPKMRGEHITHRVKEITEDADGTRRLLTKGDANLSVDGYYVTAENLVGRVFWQSGDSWIAAVVDFLTGRFGFLACIVFPALLIAALILRDNVRTMKQDIRKVVEQLETDTKKATPPVMTDQEYEQLRDEVRAQLIEELKQGDQQRRDEQK